MTKSPCRVKGYMSVMLLMDDKRHEKQLSSGKRHRGGDGWRSQRRKCPPVKGVIWS
jgi:hypothetical protein